MTVHRGKVHDYLGMTLDYTTAGKVKLLMLDYVAKMLEAFRPHDDCDRTATTPAAEHLFIVNPDCPKLPEENAKTFHNFVAKSLFLTKRARPDIATAVAFMTTRVKGPDDDDWKKLVRMMRYLRGTPNLSLILEASKEREVLHWADGSFAVHPDMKGHNGVCTSLGKGMLRCVSNKQKLNATSSTESELIAAHEGVPNAIWMNQFLEEQGFQRTGTCLFQDNKSAILLEENGRKSSSKRTRHLNIRFFYIADCIKRGELYVKYEPTQEMIADYFTKPLQGQLFYKLRKMVMNSD